MKLDRIQINHRTLILVMIASSLLSLQCSRRSSNTYTEPPYVPIEIKKVVTTGPGINFNASTGSWSEMDIDPATKMPAIVYYDRTAQVSAIAGALKFAKMNSVGSWEVEVVDTNAAITATTNTCGGGATSANCIGAPNVTVPTASQGQIYDIKFFNSSGTTTPVIGYVYGSGGTGASASGKSVRFAKRNSNGTWSIETAVSGAQIMAATTGAVGPQLATLQYPVKALRMLIDDNNRVHLTFIVYAATANSSVYLYSMRGTDGTWTSPTVISTSSPSTLAVVSGSPTYAAGTGVNQAAAAWCKYTSGGSSASASGMIISTASTDNSPAASTQGFVLQCSSVNADGSCSAWNGLDFHSGCSGAACVSTTPDSAAATANQFSRSDIAIDPTNGKIYLSYLTSAPTLTSPASIATGILTTVSPAACDSALSSSAWATVRAHPTAAQGTLGLRIATDGTSLFMASLAAATGTSIVLNSLPVALASNWTTTEQITVEATTNTIGGGFSYDSSTGVIWGSYGALTAAAAGATGQDLKAFSAYSGDINSTTGIVNNWYVDQTNFITQPTAVPMLDAKVAPDGTIGYTYFYQEPGTAGPNSKLYYGFRGGSASSPLFGEKIVTNAIAGATTFMNGLHPSLAYDSQSNPVIAFLDQGVAASSGYLMLARSSDKGVSFNLDRIDGSAAATRNVGQYTSVDITSSDTIGIAYYDFSTGASGQRLKFAKRTKNGSWLRSIVDGPGSTGTGCDTTASAGIGMHAQFAWTSTGTPVIVYQGAVSGTKSLKLAYATESETSTSYSWKCIVLDNDSQGANTRGEGIDLSLTSADVPLISHYDLTAGAVRFVSCSQDVATCAASGTSGFTTERLNYIIGSITSIASKTGIKRASDGRTWISFHSAADNALYVAARSTSGTWDEQATTVEASPSNLSSPLTGQFGVLLINTNNYPMLFYRSYENWIKYYSKEY